MVVIICPKTEIIILNPLSILSNMDKKLFCKAYNLSDRMLYHPGIYTYNSDTNTFSFFAQLSHTHFSQLNTNICYDSRNL